MTKISLKSAKEAQGATKSKTRKTDAKNRASIKRNLAKKADLMYKYPADLTLEEKKKFRAKARRRLPKAIQAVKKNNENAPKARKWLEKTYTTMPI